LRIADAQPLGRMVVLELRARSTDHVSEKHSNDQ
jgi:hypothetical protein